jgi:phosphatidate cytidylyltransferase
VEEKKNNKLASFLTRLLSGIVLIAMLFFVLYKGGNVLFFVCITLSICGLIELFQVLGLQKSGLSYIAYIFTIFYYVMVAFYQKNGILLFLIVFLLLLLMFYVLSYPEYHIKEVAITFFSIIYVAVTFSFIYLIRIIENTGIYFVWLIFIASWGSDTCAYCIGMLFGKHKLSPILSPNKTIEGMVGGIIGAGILGFLYSFILNRVNINVNMPFLTNSINIYLDIPLSSIQVGIACAIGSIISMIGDLTASAIKRDYSVKDYGNIIPGHGGVLDRFDSVIFTAPALYFILIL